jgi:prepilin-type N-terminal cleavage/methylation domain-containing protein
MFRRAENRKGFTLIDTRGVTGGIRVKQGFTLIELLVVIAIIGLLSSVALASLSTARTKARDAKRVSDIKNIFTALQLYQDRYGCLPTTYSTACGNAAGPDTADPAGWDYSSQGVFMPWLATGTEPIMKKIPVDPLNNMPGDNTAGTYAYRYYCYSDGLSLGYWKELPTRTLMSASLHHDPDFTCK